MIVAEGDLHSLDNHTKAIGTGIGPNASTTTVSLKLWQRNKIRCQSFFK
jgi:hypothetical protein